MHKESQPTYYPLAHPVLHLPLGVSPGVSILIYNKVIFILKIDYLPGQVKHLLVPNPLHVKQEVSQAEQMKLLTPGRE